MTINTGLGDDSIQFYDDNPSPVIWVWGAIALGAFLLLKGFNSNVQKETFKRKRMNKQARMIGEFQRKAVLSKPKKSKILSSKDASSLFGDL